MLGQRGFLSWLAAARSSDSRAEAADSAWRQPNKLVIQEKTPPLPALDFSKTLISPFGPRRFNFHLRAPPRSGIFHLSNFPLYEDKLASHAAFPAAISYMCGDQKRGAYAVSTAITTWEWYLARHIINAMFAWERRCAFVWKPPACEARNAGVLWGALHMLSICSRVVYCKVKVTLRAQKTPKGSHVFSCWTRERHWQLRSTSASCWEIPAEVVCFCPEGRARKVNRGWGWGCREVPKESLS